MIAQKSPIKLDHFAVLRSNFEFFQPQKEPKDLRELFDSYQLDIDFAHPKEDSGEIKVFVKIGVNQSVKPVPGYKLFIEAIGVFYLPETEIPDKEINNLKYYSTVNMMIGYLRNSLSGITASAPLGPYFLPPIDIGDLFKQKADIKRIKEEREK